MDWQNNRNDSPAIRRARLAEIRRMRGISRRESLPVTRAQRRVSNCRHAEKCLQ